LLKSRGFTLIELLVSVAIIGVVLTVVMMNQSGYTEAAALSALADDVGASLAEAQAYGIAVKERTPGSSDFSAAYGLTLSLLSSGDSKAYLSFVDRNGNQIYDGTWSCATGGTEECVSKTTITRGNYLAQICVLRSSGSNICDIPERVDVSFARPNLAARIKLFSNGGQEYAPANVIGAKLVFKSAGGLTRSVSIYQNGQVSVQ
jgi:prepilin-type N-terminal cleavage/methylation domain-containing protein